MSSRREEKDAAREARLAAERTEQSRAVRQRRLLQFGGLIGVVVVAAAVIIVLAGSSGGDEPTEGGVDGVAESQALLEGIPQNGTVLGDPGAPVTVTEFADLQCPFCRDYALQVLPSVIDAYVRTGEVKLDLRLLRFIGPDSDRGALAAAALAEEDRMWDFVDLWYRNQGPEGSGYATDEFIGDLARAAGTTEEQALEGIAAPASQEAVEESESLAERSAVSSTPSFTVATGEERPQPLEVTQLDFEAFERALEPFLAQR